MKEEMKRERWNARERERQYEGRDTESEEERL